MYRKIRFASVVSTKMVRPQMYNKYLYSVKTKEHCHQFNSLNSNQLNFYQLQNRQQNLDQILNQKDYDVIIIGGGASGSGVYLDCVSRGINTLLIEQEDFSSGTSSKSTKLIHGGIRYLEDVFKINTSNFKQRKEKYDLVKEALEERQYFINNAFYMNKSIDLVIPATGILQTMYFYTGMLIYHLIYAMNTNNKLFTWPSIHFSNKMSQMFPKLKRFGGGVSYQDGQMNDSRMNLDLLLTGSSQNYAQILQQHNEDKQIYFKPGNILNYSEFHLFIKDENNQINGIQLKDKLTNKIYQIKSKIVVNCTGAFSDKIRKKDDPKVNDRILMSTGSHLTLPISYLPQTENKADNKALVLPETSDGRIIFLIPWQNELIVGTTEGKIQEPTINPKVTQNETSFILKEISQLYPNLSQQQLETDLKSKWSGIRPLVLSENTDSKEVARVHQIEVSKSGLISLMGGKWTTYRIMGEETTDLIMKQLQDQYDYKFISCQTKNLKLIGEFNKKQDLEHPQRENYLHFFIEEFQSKYNNLFCHDTVLYLIENYGDRAFEIGKIAQERQELREKLDTKYQFTKAEVVYQIRHEMAQNPVDILFRRLRIGFIDAQIALNSLKTVNEIFSQELNWTLEQKDQNYEKYYQQIKQMEF